MSNFKVSVIIPVYNGAGKELLLKKQLDSVLNQTYKNIEVILVNDGSKDNSSELCQMYALTDSRIKVVDKQNGGESSSRNIGIDFAIGDYVSIIDQDDELDLNMYKKMIEEAADKYYPDVIKSNWYSLQKQTIHYSVSEHPYNVLLDRQYLEENIIPYLIGIKIDSKRKLEGHWSLVIKNSILKNNNIRYCENLKKENDHRFLVNVFAYADSLVLINDSFYHWIKRSNSHSKDFSPRFFNFLLNFEFYENLFRNKYDFKGQDKIRYNIDAAIDSILYVLYNKFNINKKEEIKIILKNDKFKEWMLVLEPRNPFERILKDDILNCWYNKGYYDCFLFFVFKRIQNQINKIHVEL